MNPKMLIKSKTSSTSNTDLFPTLPPELKLLICSHLDHTHLRLLSICSKLCRLYSDDAIMWRNKLVTRINHEINGDYPYKQLFHLLLYCSYNQHQFIYALKLLQEHKLLTTKYLNQLLNHKQPDVIVDILATYYRDPIRIKLSYHFHHQYQQPLRHPFLSE